MCRDYLKRRSITLARKLVDDVRKNTVGRNAQGEPALGAMLAAKMPAQALGFEGPAIAFNGACASSLQAFVQGVRAVELGRLEMALGWWCFLLPCRYTCPIFAGTIS